MAEYVITIDGPSASGKTSVSRDVANAFGWRWVSTGAFYRGLAVVALKEKIDFDDESALVRLANSPIWSVEMNPNETTVMYSGQRINPEIALDDTGMYASKISQYPLVRQALLPLQRACANKNHVLIAEGRDCGTVVFPNALIKIYLTASSDSRAQRRSIENTGSFEMVRTLQEERDRSDEERTHAPLQIPDGAQVIDSSTMNRDQVVDNAKRLIRQEFSRRKLDALIR
ncbi:MAG: (d)CMP kinase [Bdellovibrionaceae bacterium]|nr:(d)CMP kinase [Pseudobdellovibrionaceae bacterium]